ncbi:MAG: hypothetical protein JXJ04_10870 [Spirochaetales bacterium]|nr:hypothetical protein [Spirochaetales bacterium]
MDKKNLSQLLNEYHSEGVEEEINRLGLNAVPVIIGAFKTLKHYDSVRSQWYCSLLQKFNMNLLKDLCKISFDIPPTTTNEFCWLFRSEIYTEDPKQVLLELERCIGFSPGESGKKDFYLRNYYLPAGLIELLARCKYNSCAPYCDTILEYQLPLHDPMKPDYVALCGEEYLTASLSSALLYFIEAGYSSRFSSKKLVELAAAAYIKGKKHSAIGPLPLLFIPATQSGLIILEKIANTLDPVDPLLSDLNYWFKISEEFQVDDLLFKAGLTPLDWLSTLEKKCDAKSYGPGCALYIRKKLDPESANYQSMELLLKIIFTQEDFRLIMQGIRIETCAPDLLLLYCEVKYFFSNPGKTEDWKTINKRLEQMGMNPVKDWSWMPDVNVLKIGEQGRFSELVREYSTLLKDPEKLPGDSKKIPVILCLARIRLLLSAMKKKGSCGWKTPELFIHSIREKSILEALYHFTVRIIGDNEDLMGIFLNHPFVDEESKFIDELVSAAVKSVSEKMKTLLVNFAFRLGWSPEKGDYGIWNKLTLYFAQVAEERIIDKLVPLKGTSGLGSAFEIALLNLGEKYPDRIKDADFNSALSHLLSDGYTDYKLLFFENRAKAAITKLAQSDKDLKTAAYGISRIIEAKKDSFHIGPDFIILLLKKIQGAIKNARDNPGEFWEDRNWGGYNMTPEENFAQTISNAIRNLASLTYNKTELEKIKKLSQVFPAIDLKKIVLVESTSYSIDYKSFDLDKALGF